MKAEKREVWKKKSLNEGLSVSKKPKMRTCEVKKKNRRLLGRSEAKLT